MAAISIDGKSAMGKSRKLHVKVTTSLITPLKFNISLSQRILSETASYVSQPKVDLLGGSIVAADS